LCAEALDLSSTSWHIRRAVGVEQLRAVVLQLLLLGQVRGEWRAAGRKRPRDVVGGPVDPHRQVARDVVEEVRLAWHLAPSG
jgi:hypothetical protein